MQFICLDDYEAEASRRMPKEALDYYRSGADEEVTLKANRDSFSKWRILPRFLRDVSRIDMSTQVLGHQLPCPIGVSPTAMHKLAHPDGELATGRGAARFGSIMILSTLSTVSIEHLAEQEPNLVKWFQLYLFTNRQESLDLIRRAEAAGFKALVLTVDAPKIGTRRRDVRNNFKIAPDFLGNFDHKSAKSLQQMECIDSSIKWSDLAWLVEVSKVPVIIKGLLSPEDCIMALDYGVSAIVVSNHGGRQLDSAPATVEVLGPIARAVNGRVPILVDGGIRTGTDVFKCLALGADMVFLGRPVLWGLACDGSKGVERVLEILKSELELTMMLAGCPDLRSIGPDMIIHQDRLSAKL